MWIYCPPNEFKCPYTKKDMSPLDICAETNFYDELVNGHFQLKRRQILSPGSAPVVCEQGYAVFVIFASTLL